MPPLTRGRRPTAAAVLIGAATAALALGASAPAQAADSPAPQSHLANTARPTAQVPLTSNADATAAPATIPPWQGLAKTPPMGWNDWSYYQCNINEKLVLAQGRALVTSGLAGKGYDTVTTDDCWMQPTRDAAGNLQANTTLFPAGMAYVGRRLHAMGLKFGIYEDAGTKTCGGYAGSWDHWQADADLFAKWGVDYLKLDGCNVPVAGGQSADQVYRAAYKAMSDALVKSGRKIVFSESAPAYFQGTPDWFDVISWCPLYGNLWREGADIALGQESGEAKWDSLSYNYSYNVGLSAYAGPGHWNDPDFLLVGDDGLSTAEEQSQMTLWAEMAAPLISSTDLTKLSSAQKAILANTDIIAVDQDRLGVQGSLVETTGSYDILNKPLANGDRAVVLFNKGDAAQTLSVKANTLGLTGQSFTLKDLVSKARTHSSGTISANVPPHGTRIFRVSKGTPVALPSATSVTVTSPGSIASQRTTVTVALENDGSSALRHPRVRLAVPDGWTVKPASQPLTAVPARRMRRARFTVTPDAASAPGEHAYALVATARYTSAARAASNTGEETVVTNVPYPSLAAAFDNVGVSDESNTTPGNFDGSGDSYSAQALATAGVTPGGPVPYGSVSFTWPDVAAGTPDNVAASGQIVNVGKSGGTLSVLGSETTGSPHTVTLALVYTDGTSGTATIGTPNWLDDGSDFGQTTVIHTTYRNTPSGPANFGLPYDVYGNTIALNPAKTLASITMPDDVTIHVFDLQVTP